VPAEEFIWQDRVPAAAGEPIDDADVAVLKAKVLDSGLSIAQLVRTAWASASTYRGTDKRGGANGARIALAPQSGWAVNNPADLATVIGRLTAIKDEFNAAGGKQVSLADLIVLAGGAAIEKAAKAAGSDVVVPFRPGRTDATQEQTDVESFSVLEPTYDGFRNYAGKSESSRPTEWWLVEKANLMGLTAPELTVLVGGLRTLNANYDGSALGVLTDRPETLTTDFFVNLLDMATAWEPVNAAEETFVGRDRATGQEKWTASRVDLALGSNSILRALAEVYGADDAQNKFVADFVAAWDKVMNLGRFDR